MEAGNSVRDYVFESKIGQGGMGEVWSARHELLDRRVAIKVMAPHLMADPEFEARFIKEAQAQARLQHPSIIGATDFFREQGRYYLVMPLIEGRSLEEKLAASPGPLPVEDALRISADVLSALDYAHQRAVIHRDVKPSNILLDNEGHAYLTDFGIALMMGADRRTRAGVAVGTVHYMSPEQIRRPKSIDHRTDVYSFGCVLYEMLTGHPPFEAEDNEEDTDYVIKEMHVHQLPKSPQEWNQFLPGVIGQVVLRALAKSPDERFVSCGEFLRAIGNYLRNRSGESKNEFFPKEGNAQIAHKQRDTGPGSFIVKNAELSSAQLSPKGTEQTAPLQEVIPPTVEAGQTLTTTYKKKFWLSYAGMTTVAGVILFWVFRQITEWVYIQNGYLHDSSKAFRFLVPIVIGLIFGASQWLILRRYIERIGWWVRVRVMEFLFVDLLCLFFLDVVSSSFFLLLLNIAGGAVIWLFWRKKVGAGKQAVLAGPVASLMLGGLYTLPYIRYYYLMLIGTFDPSLLTAHFLFESLAIAGSGLLQAFCFTQSKIITFKNIETAKSGN
ncbi:MAG: serine/threonine protein kinase [Acidobacteria bacterium]|nr:serine/threonine protein kinase [Acidobacteriota bacterium]